MIVKYVTRTRTGETRIRWYGGVVDVRLEPTGPGAAPKLVFTRFGANKPQTEQTVELTVEPGVGLYLCGDDGKTIDVINRSEAPRRG